ncbi:hypothetical protein P4S72_20225 [Vibrio sp. PP-XX7]
MKSTKTQLLAIAAVAAIFGASNAFASGVHAQKTSTVNNVQSESNAELFADAGGVDTDVCPPNNALCQLG